MTAPKRVISTTLRGAIEGRVVSEYGSKGIWELFVEVRVGQTVKKRVGPFTDQDEAEYNVYTAMNDVANEMSSRPKRSFP